MAEILWQRTVVRDGWHNAFTDLCFWRNSYWLSYRRGSAHVSPDGGVVILRSVDLERWSEVAFIKTTGDDRDPKFCPVGDRLYVYFGTWLNWPYKKGSSISHECYLIPHGCYTEDGAHWSTPIPLYSKNNWLWRVRHHDGIFYCAAKGWKSLEERRMKYLDLLKSEDGLSWERSCRIADIRPFQPDEADLLFRPNGELWCIARTNRITHHSIFCVSKPPYQKWGCTDLKVLLQSPVLCECGDKVLAAGRRDPAAPWISQSTPAGNTGIFFVEKERLQPFLALPTDGDAAYPGLFYRGDGKLLISYYSQHAYRSGAIVPSTANSDDVYLAEIAVE